MILEVATFDIKPGQQAAFQAVFPQAAEVISRAAGYVSHELQQGIETDTRFLLFVRWHSVADHMEGFRQSADFAQWRALLTPHFNGMPVVEHFMVPDAAIGEASLDVLFRKARTHNAWSDRPVSEAQLHALYETLKWGPTSSNAQPMRVVFCRTLAARERLAACAFDNNRAKILAAPVTAIIAHDPKFYDQLPRLFPRPHVGGMVERYRANAALAEEHAFRSGSLQGAYLILAARALGLDCGPMSGFDNARVDAAFFGGTGYRSNFICSLGHGLPSGVHPRGPRLAFDEACQIA